MFTTDHYVFLLYLNSVMKCGLITVNLDTMETKRITPKKIKSAYELTEGFKPLSSAMVISGGKIGVLSAVERTDDEVTKFPICLVDLSSGKQKKILDISPGSGQNMMIKNITEVKQGVCLFETVTEFDEYEKLSFETLSWKNEKLPKAINVWLQVLEKE